MASMQPGLGRILSAWSDFPHPIQFRFSKGDLDHIVQSRPRSHLDGLSGFGKMHLVWKQVDVQESSGLVSGRVLPACYQFPIFRLSSVLPQMAWLILCKNQPGYDLVLADCVRFWPKRSRPEASQCATIIWPTSGQCFPADLDRIRIGSGMFTGLAG